MTKGLNNLHLSYNPSLKRKFVKPAFDYYQNEM